jgi:hypothetical protein
MKQKSVRLVVSRFRENLEWVARIQKEVPTLEVVVYDKSEGEQFAAELGCFSSIQHLDKPGIIFLKNWGREAHTYLWHVLHNYESLRDVEIFVQGNPWDHLKKRDDFRAFLYEVINKTVEFRQLPVKRMIALKEGSFRDSNVIPWIKDYVEKIYGPGILLRQMGEDILFPSTYMTYTNAMFAVSASVIRSHRRVSYLRLLELFSEMKDRDDCRKGFSAGRDIAMGFEFFWKFLFDPDNVRDPLSIDALV